jgi:pimeloyl-ACP methyl ester carboxylesterase
MVDQKNDPPGRPVNRDAVVVLPGIMGSELVERDTGLQLWGLTDPGWYLSAWTGGEALRKLAVTEEELSGRTDRVVATGLLKFAPAVAPMLRGVEPYTRLVQAVTSVTVHPDAVLEFPYDWRLPVAYNATLLAEAAERHLTAWRAHPAGSAAARLVFVAHSMGGLVAHCLASRLASEDFRALIALGTPFRGAATAASILAQGRFGLPRRRLRRLAATLPGVYDLLPTHPCVEDGQKFRRLDASDVERLGGDRVLAEQALRVASGRAAVPGLSTVVGADQRTMLGMRLADGTVEALHHLTRTDGSAVAEHGDGTVYRGSATFGTEPHFVAQKHGSLGRTGDVLTQVRNVLTGEQGIELGVSRYGLDTPDVIDVGQRARIVVRSTTDDLRIDCRVQDISTGEDLTPPAFHVEDDTTAVARMRFARPGVYRVSVKGGGGSSVSELVMVLPTTGGGSNG